MTTKTWLITGASRGFGQIWATAALERGDRVAATVRDLGSLAALHARFPETLLPLKLDVTDRGQVFASVATAVKHFGGLDVVVGNAGYGLFGTAEEVTEEQARRQLDVNFFGALWLTQAVVPVLRGQGHGHLIQVSSIGGVAAFPTQALYHASKFALEGLTESVAQEVAGFGINVTLLEPGPYGTDWGGASAVHAGHLDVYEPIRKARAEAAAGRVPVDPAVTAPAVLALADATEPPLRMFLGDFPYPVAERVYRQRLDLWQQWRPVAATA